MEEQMKIKTVFGKELDLSQFEGVDVREVLAPINQLKLEGKDPNYVYGWLDTSDPGTQIKIRKGVWEPVKEDDLADLIVAGKTSSEDGNVHVRELLLVRMPKDKFDALQRAYAYLSLRRSTAVEQSFKDRTQGIAKQITPDASADPRVTTSAEVKEEKKSWKRS